MAFNIRNLITDISLQFVLVNKGLLHQSGMQSQYDVIKCEIGMKEEPICDVYQQVNH